MQTVKLTMGRGKFAHINLYRYSLATWDNGLPKRIEHYVKDQEIRDLIGRWHECRNINVSVQIAKLIDGIGEQKW